MRLKFEGSYLVSNSYNSIINNKIGPAYYDAVLNKFVFKLLQALDEDDIGDYYVDPKNLSKVENAEIELMNQTRIYINRPDGYDIIET